MSFRPSSYSYGASGDSYGDAFSSVLSGAQDTQILLVEEKSPDVGTLAAGLVMNAATGAVFGGVAAWLLRSGIPAGARIGALSAVLAVGLPLALDFAAKEA